jgi:enterochelin esterase-like enzyme
VEGRPVIGIDGRRVTFTAPDGAAYLMGDFTDWDERPIPLDGPVTLEFCCGGYVEYAFLDARGGPVADPENPVRPRHPWYDYHRSLTLPGNRYHSPSDWRPVHGTISEHVLDSRRRRQRYWIYEPPSEPRSTMYVLDGGDFHQRLGFHRVADALIEAGRIWPIRMVLVEPQDRLEEYWLSEAYEDFVLTELLPHVERDRSRARERAMWGASLGGLFAAWAAWRHPDVFCKVGSQSGCFTAAPREGRPDASYYHDPEWLTDLVAREAARPLRLYMDTGQIEWLLPSNRRFAAVLADRQYPHCYREHPSGHNWTTWEQGLEPGLLYLFGDCR